MINKNRKIRFNPTAFLISAVLFASGGALKTDAAVLLSDGMDYANDTTLQSAWTSVHGNGNVKTQTSYTPAPLAGQSDSPVSGKFMELDNQVVYRELSANTAGDWSLSAKLLHNTYGRRLIVFLLNETGTQGYGMLWDSAQVSSSGGEGFYRIRKFDNSSYTDWTTFGNGISIPGDWPSSHPITGYAVTSAPSSDQDTATYDTASWADFVSLRLEWTAATGTLTLFENNVQVGQVVDTSFTNFKRIYLSGNTAGFFDDIELNGTFYMGGYAGWAASYPALVGGESDDEDNDGLSNLEEYALGGNPTNANDIGYVPTTGVSGDFFEVIHVRRIAAANELLYYLEQNEDLVASPGWDRTGEYEITGIGPFPANPEFEVVTNQISMVGNSQEFFQLKVSNRSDPFPPLFNTTTFGATVPFVTLEGEDAAATSGSIVQLGAPYPWPSTPAQEASGRAFVELDSTGEYVEFNVPADADGMVIRHCIPDAPGGGGMSATLGLYVNGVRVQDVNLSSKFNWLYITDPTPYSNGQDNTPNGFPHVFWDETRLLISGGVVAGDVIRLQKDAGDTAAYYRIDLVELEEVPPPLTQPANSLSIADYGADGSSAANDTPAIKNCIAAAQAQGKTVWFPVGTFLQDEYFTLTGVRVQGAGMWHTTLSDTVGDAGTNGRGHFGFYLQGDGPGVSDMMLNSLENTRRQGNSPRPLFGRSNNWAVERVWITHTAYGMWLAGNNGVVRDCRVRFTYADGINVNDGSAHELNNVLVENNHVRGTGDDGIAVLAHMSSPGKVSQITVRHNTVIAPYWAANLDMTGGTDILMHNNVLADGGGFVVNLPSAYGMEPLDNALFTYNKIMRCGYISGGGGQRRGAIWILPNTSSLSDFRIENNVVEDALYHGIEIVGTQFQEILFKNNTINNSGRKAVSIGSSANGIGTFEDNVSTGSSELPYFDNNSGTYTVVDDGSNSWN